jgi:hypothetical protein
MFLYIYTPQLWLPQKCTGPKTQVFWDDVPCWTVTSWHSITSTKLQFPAAPLWYAQISQFTKRLTPFLREIRMESSNSILLKLVFMYVLCNFCVPHLLQQSFCTNGILHLYTETCCHKTNHNTDPTLRSQKVFLTYLIKYHDALNKICTS